MYIAPSREEAAPLLIARHGSEMAFPWQRIMKMRFLAGDVLKNVPYEEIAERYSISLSEVKAAAATMLIREMIREAEIDDNEKDKFLSEKFQASTLTRFIETAKFVEKTGFEVSGSSIRYTIPQQEFLQIILRLFRDIDEKDIDARNDVNYRSNYLTTIFNEIASGETENNSFEAKNVAPLPERPEPRRPRTRSKRERLIPDTTAFTTGALKLDALIQEGQKMTVGAFPHASGLLIRTILDLSIQRLFDKNDVLAETQAGDGRTLGLTKRINILHSNHRDWFENATILTKMKRFVAKDSGSFVHIETLNDYAHGDYGQPTKEDLRNFWAQIAPLIDMILEED